MQDIKDIDYVPKGETFEIMQGRCGCRFLATKYHTLQLNSYFVTLLMKCRILALNYFWAYFLYKFCVVDIRHAGSKGFRVAAN